MRYNLYLGFNGNAKDAFAFYKEVFGDTDASYMKYGDAPDNDFKGEEAEKVLHGEVKIGEQTLMMSDTSAQNEVVIGTNTTITINVSSVEEFDEIFAKISEGAKVEMGPEETFFAQKYTELVDKFGIRWQVILQKEQ